MRLGLLRLLPIPGGTKEQKMNSRKDPARIRQAVARLYRELRDGREFPDALAASCVICNVDSDDLRDAYDEAEAEFAERHPL
jgi:hypothetical protein